MISDILSVRRTTTGTAVSGGRRIRGFIIMCGGTAGSVVFRDGGGSGAIVLQVDTPASATSLIAINLAQAGIRCLTDIHVTLTNVTSVVVMYD